MEVSKPPCAYGIVQFTYLKKEESLYEIHEGYTLQVGLINETVIKLRMRFKYPGIEEAIFIESPLFESDDKRDKPYISGCEIYKIDANKIIIEGSLNIPQNYTGYKDRWLFTGRLSGCIPAQLPVWDCVM